MRPRLPRLLLLTTALLISCAGATTIAATTRRSINDLNYDCLQLSAPSGMRSVIDTRSKEWGFFHSRGYRFVPDLSILQSPDRKFVAHISYSDYSTGPNDAVKLWLQDADDSHVTEVTRLPAQIYQFFWVSERVLFFAALGDHIEVAGSVSIDTNGEPNLAMRVATGVYAVHWKSGSFIMLSADTIHIWTQRQNDWVDIDLPVWAHTLLPLAVVPEADSDRLWLSYQNNDSNSTFVLIDPLHEYPSVLRYTQSEHVISLFWSPNGNYVTLLVGTAARMRLDIWKLSKSNPQLLEQMTIRSSQNVQWLWSTDEKSAVYAITGHDQGITIYQHNLYEDFASDRVLIEGQARTTPTLVHTKLLITFRQNDSDGIVMVSGDADIVIVAEGITEPLFHTSEDAYALYYWSSKGNGYLLLIDTSTGRYLEISVDAENMPSQNVHMQPFGELLLMDLGTSSERHYVAVNTQTLLTIPLVPTGFQITELFPNLQSSALEVYWANSNMQGLSLFAMDGVSLGVFEIANEGRFLWYAPDNAAALFEDDKRRTLLVQADNNLKLLTSSFALSPPKWSPTASKLAYIVERISTQANDLLVVDEVGTLLMSFTTQSTAMEWVPCH